MEERIRQTFTCQIDSIKLLEEVIESYRQIKKANFKIEEVVSEEFDTVTISFDSGFLDEVFYLGSLYGITHVHDELGLTREQYKQLKFKNKGVY